MFLKTKIRPFMKNLYDDMPNGYQKTIEKGAACPVDMRLARTGTEWRHECCEILY